MGTSIQNKTNALLLFCFLAGMTLIMAQGLPLRAHIFLTYSIHIHHVTQGEAINIPCAVQMLISDGWCSSDSVSLLQRELGNALIHHGYWDPQRAECFHIHYVFSRRAFAVCVSCSEDQRGLQAWAKACQGHPVTVWQAETVLLAAVSKWIEEQSSWFTEAVYTCWLTAFSGVLRCTV